VAAEVAAAAAWRGWPAWQRRQQLGGSGILAVAAARLEVRRQRGSGGNNVALAAAAWHMLTIIAMVTMTTMIDY
jgi:hypothetical protein